MKNLIIKLKIYSDKYFEKLKITNEGFKRLFFIVFFIPYLIWLIVVVNLPPIIKPDYKLIPHLEIVFLNFLIPILLLIVLNILFKLFNWIKDGFSKN